MAASDFATLELAARTPEGSRSARRLRREGMVPGTLYGAGDEPRSFQVDARILRNALAHAHAVIEVSVDGGQKQPVMVKDLQRHPVRGETVHVDLLRVRDVATPPDALRVPVVPDCQNQPPTVTVTPSPPAGGLR